LHRLLYVAAGFYLFVAAIHCASGEEIDTARLAAAKAHANARWEGAGYDAAAPFLDVAAINDNADRTILAHLAKILLVANPGNAAGVLNYANNGLVPFIKAHRGEYLCLLTQHYYNMTAIPTAELATFSESGMVAMFDHAYLLGNTERARHDARVFMPDDDYGTMIMAAIGRYQKSKWSSKGDKTLLDCIPQ
jgi:hypothetical protein